MAKGTGSRHRVQEALQREDLANEVTWYSDANFPLMPPPRPPNNMEDLDKRIEDVL